MNKEDKDIILELGYITTIQLKHENKQLKEELSQKNKIIEKLKEDMINAINEAINDEINLEFDTHNRGRYDVYVYVLDKIQELEKNEE